VEHKENQQLLSVRDKIATTLLVEALEIRIKFHKEAVMKNHTLRKILDQISLLPLSFKSKTLEVAKWNYRKKSVN